MAKATVEIPHLVQAEGEWFKKRDNERRNKDEVGPSRVIKAESEDEIEEFNTFEEETMALCNTVDTQPDK